jgi:hypothetical protein
MAGGGSGSWLRRRKANRRVVETDEPEKESSDESGKTQIAETVGTMVGTLRAVTGCGHKGLPL